MWVLWGGGKETNHMAVQTFCEKQGVGSVAQRERETPELFLKDVTV